MRNGTARVTALLATLAIVVTACTVTFSKETGPSTSSHVTERGDRPQAIPAAFSLETFDACEGFLDYVISHAVDLVGPYGLENPVWGPWPVDDLAMMDGDAAAEASTSPARSQDFSGTNVQVEGVDEPDIVKTDGERIVLISDGSLIVVDVTGDEPRETGRLRLDGLAVQSLFLSGDTALLFGSSWLSHPVPFLGGDVAEFAPIPQSPTVRLIEVEIGSEPEIVRTMSIDGSFISGRMIGDSARLVITSGPVGFEWSYPSGSGLRAEREAIEANREIIRNSTEENWIPYYLTTDSDGDVIDEGILFDCDRARRPEEFAGLNMLSVMTIDVGEGLEVADATGVVATGSTVYSSLDNLYVATQGWQTGRWARGEPGDDRPESVTTEIHKFDVSDASETEYVATGQVEGFLLNQFAMDEHEGLLRVASTTSPNWWGSGFESQSMVTVLHEVNGELVRVGRVDGLGESEQIYSVRFMGDVGYVVTFRQTDPLYTLDLSDPTDPRVVGDLKILGYSAYLHPLGGDLLMGVGQDATEEGRIQGTQVSIFDVSDPANADRVDTYTLSEGSNSQVEYDHHAFLYWDPERLAMIPVQQWRWDDKGEEAFFGAIGLRVSESGDLVEVEKVVHPGGIGEKNWDWRAQILRSVVIGDSVYTISAKGILKSDIEALQETAWLDF
jgi:hypothetical protein